MPKDILGNPYRPARYWADGSRPLHARATCQGADPHPCPWHAPSRHKMRDWPRVIRFTKLGMVERQCGHGVGHPDPDSVAFIGKHIAAGPHSSLSIHGCCLPPCCAP